MNAARILKGCYNNIDATQKAESTLEQEGLQQRFIISSRRDWLAHDFGVEFLATLNAEVAKNIEAVRANARLGNMHELLRAALTLDNNLSTLEKLEGKK